MRAGPAAMTVLRRGTGVVAGVAAAIGIAWASSAPLTLHGSPDALLRLAWSARPEHIQTCRRATEEELSALPSHMRQELVCEGTTASYRLQVRWRDRVLADEIVQGGGLRRDRRLYVLREFSLPAGDAVLEVRMDRIEPGEPATAAVPAAPAAGPAGLAMPMPHVTDPNGGTVPPTLTLVQRVRFPARKVVLVTYDPDRRTLVVQP